nr:reverse transcriptase domain-containing protein [Tanacetum cinerariifolium]
MRTRSKSYSNNSNATIPRHSNRRRVSNIVEPEIRTIEEVVPMADRTIKELLQAPTKGYGEAIVIPEILIENFEIKTNLLQLVETNKFHDFERDNPHIHISNFKRMTSTLKYRDVPNDVIKLMLFPYSPEGAARICNQPSVCATTGTYNQVSSPNRASHQIPPPGFAPVQNNPNSGLAYEGASIPTNSPFEKVVERDTKEIMDKEHSNYQGSTAHIQPLVFPISILEPNVPKTQPKPTIPYPSRLNDQKLREKATNQMEKFFQIFHDLNFKISFANTLLLMPKFASTIKSLLTNKDKFFKLAKVPLNENCSAMLFKKLPEKLGDPGKFLIPCDFSRIDLLLPELTPTRMTLELADRSITRPKGVAKDVFVKVGKFHFPTDFMVVDFKADPRVHLILGRSFLRSGRALIDVYGEEITLRVNDESVTFHLIQTMKYSSTYDDNFVNRVDVIDIACEEFVQDGDILYLEKMLKRCEDTNLVLNWEKCHFMCKEGIVLGHKISKSRIEVDRAKVDVIAKLPHPTTITGVRSFLGHAGFYRRFIQDFSKIARPMTHLLEKETPFVFSKECIDAFDTLKKKLTEAPILVVLDWNLPFELMCDASDFAIGAERTKKLHDSKIKNRIFNVGDQVLLFNSRLNIFSGKLKTRWSGPFTITHVFPYGTVELSQPNGPNFKVNGHCVKHYFGGDIPSMVVPDLHTQLSEYEIHECEIFEAASNSSVSEIDEDNNQANDSVNHLIKDCNFYDNKMVEKSVVNNKGKVAAKSRQVLVNAAKKTSAALTSIARPKVNTAVIKPNANAKYSYFKPHSPKRSHFNKKLAAKTNTFSRKINTAKGKNVTTAWPKAVVNAAEGKKENGNPYYTLQDQGIFDSGCFRNMTGNMSFLIEYQVIDGGFVAFGGSPKGGDLACLFTKATIDESNLRHRRLGHINFEMNQFCQMKRIKREFSASRNLQQNGVAESRNRTLVEVARTMLADSLLPTTFWAEAVNTACYVQNRVLVTKSHNKTPYELLIGRSPNLEFMRPFGYHVTILNTLNHLGKFDGKADEGFLVGYFVNSKAFRVFNSRTSKVEENLHVNFLENKPNVIGSGPGWLFDIDSLTKSMNYEPGTAGNQSNGDAGIQTYIHVGQASHEKAAIHEYILLPFIPSNPPFSSTIQRSDVNADDIPGDVNTGDIQGDVDEISRNDEVSTGIFDGAFNDRDLGAEADTNNLDSFIVVSPIPTTRVHKDHQKEQIIGDHNLNNQTKRMINISEEIAMEMCDAFEMLMHEKYQMSSMGELTFFLGLQVKQKQDDIFISQDKYVAKILKKFGFSKVKTTSTLMETSKPQLKDEDGQEVDVHMYRSMIGSLMYLTSSRLDIMFVICACARHQVKKVDDEARIQALIDGKRVNIKESSIRRTLRLDDAEGTSCLTNAEIFEGLARMGVKTTSWNEFSNTMASAIICLATNQKFNFSREVTLLFTNMLVQAPKEVGILQADVQSIPIPTEPSYSKPQKKHKPKRKYTKEAKVPPIEPQAKHTVPLPLPSHNTLPSGEDSLKLQELMDLCTNLSNKVLNLESEVLDIKSTYKAKFEKLESRVNMLEEENTVLKELMGVHSKVNYDEPVMEKEESSKQERKIADINADVLSMLDVNDKEPADVEEVLKVVTTAKLITKVVTTAKDDVTASSVEVPKPRKRKGVIIQNPKETTTVTVQLKVQAKDKGKAIPIEEPKRIKRQVQIKPDEEVARQLEAELNANVDWNAIIPNDDDDAYTDATPLASKIPIIDYKIHTERNRPYFKIIRADRNHMLFLSFSTMLKNFDREDLESLWNIVKERFAKTKPKNYSDDYLLNTLKIMFEKPNVEANIFLLVERMYPLTHFNLEQMINDLRHKVKDESEMSLELLSLNTAYCLLLDVAYWILFLSWSLVSPGINTPYLP